MDTLIHTVGALSPSVSMILNIVILLFAVNIHGEVRKTNGRVIRLETWSKEHSREDDERHREVVTRLNIKETR